MEVAKLKEAYGEPYNPAYDEIRKVMDSLGFSLGWSGGGYAPSTHWVQGSLYLARSEKNSLATVYKAIDTLKRVPWFKSSIRDIRAFKVEDWSDFTEIVKH